MTMDHKPSILIVDDDETYRNRLARAFVDRGYDVRTAHDHDSASPPAATESPEFAVVDLKMPGRAGSSWSSRCTRSIRPPRAWC